MLNPKLIDYFFTAASIQRWNDYPRMIDLVELDKQAHKFIIAYFIAKQEKDVNYIALIESGIFEFLRRVVVTDIRPDVFHKALMQKKEEINRWVIENLKTSIKDIDDGKFLSKFQEYFTNDKINTKERFILKAASYLATKWEFSIVYQTSSFLSDIDKTKIAIEEEIEDYYELIGVRKIALGKKLAHLVDISGRLRFQKRWAQTPRIPNTSVLGHMLIVAFLGYFYSIKINACPKRVENNFFCALFHDLPEALTRDIISPVKYSVSGLDDIISEYEINKINEEILPLVPKTYINEFKYILGLYDGKKDEFSNKIKTDKIKEVKDLSDFNEDKFNAIDGKALKECDRIAAFIEATLSMSYGVKSKELVKGKKEILNRLKQNPKINNINFYKLSLDIEKYFNEDLK